MALVTQYVPLGDGGHLDLGFVSPNGFGVDINFRTDPLTGSVPHQSAIPDPPMAEDSYELTQVGWSGCLVDCEPPPVICIVGCDGPQQPVEPEAIPEPATALLMSAALVLALLRRRYAL
jgi:hypothetical protein